MNRAQRVVLVCGFLGVCGMALYPPWLGTVPGPAPWRVRLHAWVFQAPSPQEIERKLRNQLGGEYVHGRWTTEYYYNDTPEPEHRRAYPLPGSGGGRYQHERKVLVPVVLPDARSTELDWSVLALQSLGAVAVTGLAFVVCGWIKWGNVGRIPGALVPRNGRQWGVFVLGLCLMGSSAFFPLWRNCTGEWVWGTPVFAPPQRVWTSEWVTYWWHYPWPPDPARVCPQSVQRDDWRTDWTPAVLFSCVVLLVSLILVAVSAGDRKSALRARIEARRIGAAARAAVPERPGEAGDVK